MSKNNIKTDDYSPCNCHSSCSNENKFYVNMDDTLNENYMKLSKKLACQLTSINNELNILKLLIIVLIIYIMCYRKGC